MTASTDFRAADVRGDFKDALRALSSARLGLLHKHGGRPSPFHGNRRGDNGGGVGGGDLGDVDAAELAIVDMAVEAARFDLQTGREEHAVGRLQAMVEFACFGPTEEEVGGTGTSSEAKRLRLFESFWESGDARAGEAEASGWGTWADRSKGLRRGGRGG